MMKVTFKDSSIAQLNQIENAETVTITQTLDCGNFEELVLLRLQKLETLVATLPAHSQPHVVADIESLRAVSDDPLRFSDSVKTIYRKATGYTDDMQVWTQALQDLTTWAGKAYEAWSKSGLGS